MGKVTWKYIILDGIMVVWLCAAIRPIVAMICCRS